MIYKVLADIIVVMHFVWILFMLVGFSHCSYRCFYPVRESHTVREHCSLTGFSDEIVKKVLGIKEEPLYIMPVGRKR